LIRLTSALITVALCAASAFAAPKPDKVDVETVSDAPDKVICKRYPVTGSLVQTRKVCGTKEDWVKMRENLQRMNGGANSCGQQSEGGFCSH
jgi:hypothetical protein